MCLTENALCFPAPDDLYDLFDLKIPMNFLHQLPIDTVLGTKGYSNLHGWERRAT
jgi:hypothetical protein